MNSRSAQWWTRFRSLDTWNARRTICACPLKWESTGSIQPQAIPDRGCCRRISPVAALWIGGRTVEVEQPKFTRSELKTRDELRKESPKKHLGVFQYRFNVDGDIDFITDDNPTSVH
jgi:hypothetical protein